MVRVKVCGITSQEDAMKSVVCGAAALGFIFYKKSQRFISPYKVRKIIDHLPPFVTPVGIFVNQKEGAVKDIAEFCGIKTLQFHGDEDPSFCQRFKKYTVIKAFRIKEDFNISGLASYRVAGYLFDTFKEDSFGGSGEAFNWEIIQDRKFAAPVILSGGLTPENVAQAIARVHPFAVDVASGVEKEPGKKDYHLLEDFFRNCKSAL